MNDLLDLIRYDNWANGRLVAAIRELPDEAFSAPITSSFGSIRDTFAHIVVAQWNWLRRWKGESPTSLPAWFKEGSRAELLAQFDTVKTERDRFLSGLSEQQFADWLDYRSLDGKAFHHKLADQIRHVVNHSTYHRGQAATLLRQIGVVPPTTDFIVYRREGG